MVVEAGLASTEAPVVAESPAGGSQVYVSAPDAVSVVLSPEQMLWSLTVTVGSGFTTISIVAGMAHCAGLSGVNV